MTRKRYVKLLASGMLIEIVFITAAMGCGFLIAVFSNWVFGNVK